MLEVLRKIRLYPAERLCLYMLIFTVALYALTGLPFAGFLKYYLIELKVVLFCYLLSLFIAYVVNMILQQLSARKQKKKMTEKDIWLSYRKYFLNFATMQRHLRLIHVISLTMVLFNQLKSLTPLINPSIYDSFFLGFEHAVLGGVGASELFISFFGTDSSPVFSAFYETYYPFLGLASLILIFHYNSKVAQEYVAAFVLLWFSGVLIVYLIPTWGPCFFVPEVFKDLAPAASLEVQKDLWSAWLVYKGDPYSGAPFLISGMPSLHVAVVALGTWYFRYLSPVLVSLGLIFVVLTIMGTIYLGWHYVLDDIGSFICVLSGSWGARLMVWKVNREASKN